MYARVYHFYLPKLYHFVLFLSKGSKEDAEEIVQEVFLKIWQRRESLIGVRSIEAYMFGIAKNLLHDFQRRRKHLHQIVADISRQKEEAYSPSHSDIIFKEYHKAAIDAIAKLSGKKKRIFELRTQEGYKLQEIATEMNLSVAGVKKHLYEAIHFIKEYITKNGGWTMTIISASAIYEPFEKKLSFFSSCF